MTEKYIYTTRPAQMVAAIVSSSEPKEALVTFSDYGDIESEGSYMKCSIEGRIQWNPKLKLCFLLLGTHTDESEDSPAGIYFSPQYANLWVQTIGSAFPS